MIEARHLQTPQLKDGMNLSGGCLVLEAIHGTQQELQSLLD